MTRIPTSLACLLTLVLTAGAFHANATPLGLDQVIALALQHDAQLRADLSAAQARSADGWQSVAGYGPTVRAIAAYQRSRDTVRPEDSAEMEDRLTNFHEGEVTVSLVQPIIDLEKGSQALKGLSEMDMALLLEKKAHEELLLKVHERYYRLLSAQEALRLAQAESGALHRQVSDAVARLDLGFGTITDQYDAEARYRLALAEEIARHNDLQNGVKALEELIAQPLTGGVADLPEDMTLPLLPADLATWLTTAHQHNIDYRLKHLEEKTARLHLRAAQSRFLPALVLFADYSERASDDGLFGYGEDRSEYDIGLRLETDLLAGGRDTAAAVAAARRAQAAGEQVTASRRALERSLGSLWEGLAHTRHLVEAYHQAVAANRQALEFTQASYDEGAKALLDVLNAQQEYYRSQRLLKSSRYDYMVLLEKFRQTVGVDDLGKPPQSPEQSEPQATPPQLAQRGGNHR